MRPHLNAIIILLITLLLVVLNETLLPGQIPPWVFILLLVVWLIMRFGPRFRKRK
jgi:hypothetical protein